MTLPNDLFNQIISTKPLRPDQQLFLDRTLREGRFRRDVHRLHYAFKFIDDKFIHYRRGLGHLIEMRQAKQSFRLFLFKANSSMRRRLSDQEVDAAAERMMAELANMYYYCVSHLDYGLEDPGGCYPALDRFRRMWLGVFNSVSIEKNWSLSGIMENIPEAEWKADVARRKLLIERGELEG